MISQDAIVSAAKGIAIAELDGEAILLDVNSGHYYGLNDVGARIMETAKEPVTIRALIDTLLSEYDVSSEELESDVMIFLKEMEERGLIIVADGKAD